MTTLILPISVTFEAIWGGGCNVHFYQIGQQISVVCHAKQADFVVW